jgi:iron complex outermembrane receptor protein
MLRKLARPRFGHSVSALALALGATVLSVPAQAQTSPDHKAAEPENDEIVVTARLREETLIEAPLSITAFSAEDLQSRQIESMSDLSAMTPGLEFEQASSATSSRPVIRGQAQIARTSGDVANVGIFIDGVYSSGLTGSEVSFAGVERVEVVRGPQGALYGRNTFAGAINYITARPGNDLAFGGRLSYGQYGYYEVSSYLSTPIIEDRLAVRIDAVTSSSGGYFRNQVDGKRINVTDTEMIRASLKGNIGDLNIFLTGTYTHDTSSHSALLVIPDNSPRRVGKPAPTTRSPVQIGRRVGGLVDDYTETFSFDPRAFGSERTSKRAALIMDYDFGPVTLVSRTGYEDREVATLNDLDQTPQGTNFSGNIFTQTASGDVEDRYEFSQDLRLQASNPGRFDWTIGAYYSFERNLAGSTRFAEPDRGTTAPAPVNGAPSIDQQDLNRNTFRSVYASASFDFTKSVTLALEGRYTSEKKRVLTVQNNYGTDRFTPTNPPHPEMDKTFTYFTPRAILTYQPNADLNVYLSAARGTKSGGFNPGSLLPEEMTYNPESNWTYELGVKAALFDRRLRVEAAVYQIDWSNQQISTFAMGPIGTGGDSSITTNIAQSRVNGGEVSLSYSLHRWLSINAAYAYTDARYVDGITSTFADFVDCSSLPRLECVNGKTTGNISGNQLQFSPRHQGTIGGEVRVPISGDMKFYSRADLSFNSRKWIDAGNVGYIGARQEVRVRIGIEDRNFRGQAFCKNLFNDRTPVTAFASRDFSGNPHYYARIREPRQCGVTLSYSY